MDKAYVDDIQLVKGKGSFGRGGDIGGKYWHIYLKDKRAGYVFINLVQIKAQRKKQATIQIHINKTMRGKGIGSVAYRKACELSGYGVIYAEMRKANTASRKAAEAAGFTVSNDSNTSQLTMLWRKKGKGSPKPTKATMAVPEGLPISEDEWAKLSNDIKK